LVLFAARFVCTVYGSHCCHTLPSACRTPRTPHAFFLRLPRVLGYASRLSPLPLSVRFWFVLYVRVHTTHGQTPRSHMGRSFAFTDRTQIFAFAAPGRLLTLRFGFVSRSALRHSLRSFTFFLHAVLVHIPYTPHARSHFAVPHLSFTCVYRYVPVLYTRTLGYTFTRPFAVGYVLVTRSPRTHALARLPLSFTFGLIFIRWFAVCLASHGFTFHVCTLRSVGLPQLPRLPTTPTAVCTHAHLRAYRLLHRTPSRAFGYGLLPLPHVAAHGFRFFSPFIRRLLSRRLASRYVCGLQFDWVLHVRLPPLPRAFLAVPLRFGLLPRSRYVLVSSSPLSPSPGFTVVTPIFLDNLHAHACTQTNVPLLCAFTGFHAFSACTHRAPRSYTHIFILRFSLFVHAFTFAHTGSLRCTSHVHLSSRLRLRVCPLGWLPLTLLGLFYTGYLHLPTTHTTLASHVPLRCAGLFCRSCTTHAHHIPLVAPHKQHTAFHLHYARLPPLKFAVLRSFTRSAVYARTYLAFASTLRSRTVATVCWLPRTRVPPGFSLRLDAVLTGFAWLRAWFLPRSFGLVAPRSEQVGLVYFHTHGLPHARTLLVNNKRAPHAYFHIPRTIGCGLR